MIFFGHPEPVEGTAVERIEQLILFWHYPNFNNRFSSKPTNKPKHK